MKFIPPIRGILKKNSRLRMSFLNETDDGINDTPEIVHHGEDHHALAESEEVDYTGTLNVNDLEMPPAENPAHLASRIHAIVSTQDDESEETNDDWDWGGDQEEIEKELPDETFEEALSMDNGHDDVSQEREKDHTKKRRIEVGNVHPNETAPRVAPNEVDPVNFPVAKLKALFKVGYSCGGHGGSAAVPLSADALATLNQSVALLIGDLAGASLNKKSSAPQSNKTGAKRSLTYQDITDNALQLERFSFLQEIVPVHTDHAKASRAKASQQTMDAFLGARKN
jgi:hypothetical protein